MNIRKIISLLIIAALICSVAACGSGKSGPGSGGNSSPPPTSTASPAPSPDPTAGQSPDKGDENAAGARPSPAPGTDPTTTPSASPTPDPTPSPGTGGGDPGPADTPVAILAAINEAISNAGVNMPMAMPPMGFPADTSQFTAGFSEADYNKYVTDTAQSKAAIGTFAHELLLIQAKDANAAAQLKKIMSGSDGYDAKKWVCVFPETAVVVDSGSYVLLVAASREVAEAAVEAFRNIFGSAGDVVTFWDAAR